MKIQVLTSEYEYMGLPLGLVVNAEQRGSYMFFRHNGKDWSLTRPEYEEQPMTGTDVKQDTVDMVNSPNHYILFNKSDIEGDTIEVKHVVKAILERWQSQEKISFDFYQAGCYKELLQYLLRAPLKNNYEDVAKAKYYLEEILNEW
jgi:hypothetical protein